MRRNMLKKDLKKEKKEERKEIPRKIIWTREQKAAFQDVYHKKAPRLLTTRKALEQIRKDIEEEYKNIKEAKEDLVKRVTKKERTHARISKVINEIWSIGPADVSFSTLPPGNQVTVMWKASPKMRIRVISLEGGSEADLAAIKKNLEMIRDNQIRIQELRELEKKLLRKF